MRDKAYLALVRKQPCISCGTEQRIVPHHYMENEKGTAMKVSDHHTVPLCSSVPSTGFVGCHERFHQDGALPCFTNHYEYDMAVALSRALMYRTQARLLAQWLTTF